MIKIIGTTDHYEDESLSGLSHTEDDIYVSPETGEIISYGEDEDIDDEFNSYDECEVRYEVRDFALDAHLNDLGVDEALELAENEFPDITEEELEYIKEFLEN